MTTDPVFSIFEEQGQHQLTSGNAPVLLAGPDRVWCILSGSVEVFSVQLAAGCPSGAKTHFFSVGPGDLLFGMDFDGTGTGQGFQAVGYPGTRVARLDLDHLKTAAGQDGFEKLLAGRIDSWTRGLAQGLTRDIVPRPRPDLVIEPGVETRTDQDRILVPEADGVWVEVLDKHSLYISTEEVFPGHPLVPLSKFSWMLMLKEGGIRCAATRDLLTDGRVWPSLAGFHEMIFQILFLNAGLKAADVYNFLEDRKACQQKEVQESLACLASVMDRAGSATLKAGHTPSGEHGDRLLAAVAGAASVLGLKVTAPSCNTWETDRPATLEDIARASRFPVRKVILEEGWWHQDLGPMVGFDRDTGRPMALMPRSAGAYDRLDPDTGRSARVTARAAPKIARDRAYVLYRPFPDTALSGADLIRFGLKGCARDLGRIFMLAVAMGLLYLVVPVATGVVFSTLIPSADRTMILGMAMVLVGAGITALLFEITRNIALLRVETRMHYALESALWDRLLRLSLPFFRQFETGDLADRAMGIFMVRQLVSGPVVTTILGSVLSVFNVIVLFWCHVELAWVAIGIFLAAVLGTAVLTSWQLGFVRSQARMAGKISGRVVQFLGALSKLRISGAEDNAFAAWARDFSRQQGFAFKAGVVQNILATFTSGFWLFAQMVIFSWMILKQGGSEMSTGGFLAFNAAFAALNAGLAQMILAMSQFIGAIPYYERLKPIFQACPESDGAKADPGQLSGRVEICHINFRYTADGPMILKDVSLRVEPGAFVAVVGSSGSGKSTLVRLLLGFEQAESGTVFYDDHDLSDLDVSQVRQIMGVVVQGGGLMAGDLFSNIVGSHPLTVDDAWEAARMAGLDQDIKELPMGMHTVVMEGAGTLSGGQRQRLMIARAIVNRPRILILDEATSALDNQTQALVTRSLARLKATRIVVAHRLSTIREADLIYVMDKGEIKESGDFDGLMAKPDSLFRKLAERQMI